MNRITNLITVFLVAFSSLAFGQNVTIKGTATDYIGKFISIVQKKDYISGLEEVNAKSLVDEKGNFEVAFDTDHTIKCVLRIGNINANIFVAPNKTYVVDFPKTPKEAVKTLSNSTFVQLTFENENKDDLNYQISEFNIYRDDFMDKNLDLFYKNALRVLKVKIDSFKLTATEKFGGIKNAYFINYLQYSFAELELARNKRKTDLYEEYIKPHGISYSNNQYMSFFTQYYKQRLGSMALYNQKLADAINIDESLEKVNEVLASELGYNTPRLREAALLYGLFENRNSTALTKNGIIKILTTISTSSKTPEHQQIAKNILVAVRKNMVGTKASNFELVDKNGKDVSLSDFRGKYVYIDFWATWCVPCLREMKMMKNLQKNYGDKIVIISISVDDNIDTMNKFLLKNKYNWTFLHHGNSESLKHKYDVRSIPLYYLIDPSGNFMRSPARRPSENIEPLFKKLLV